MRAYLARVDAVIIQAVIAGALSFSHLHDLAEAAGQGGWKAWAYPISVDLLLVAAWRRMREAQRAGLPSGGPRLWFLVALAASLGANIATAGLLDLDDVPASLRVIVVEAGRRRLLRRNPPGTHTSHREGTCGLGALGDARHGRRTRP